MSDSLAFDAGRAWLRGPDMFPRFAVEGEGVPLSRSKLDAREELVIARRGDAAIAFVKRQIAYHHIAQGRLAGHPYLVSW